MVKIREQEEESMELQIAPLWSCVFQRKSEKGAKMLNLFVLNGEIRAEFELLIFYTDFCKHQYWLKGLNFILIL